MRIWCMHTSDRVTLWIICPSIWRYVQHEDICPTLTGLPWCILEYKGYKESIPLIGGTVCTLSMRTYCMPNSDRITLWRICPSIWSMRIYAMPYTDWVILVHRYKGYTESIPLIGGTVCTLSMRTYCMSNSDRITLWSICLSIWSMRTYALHWPGYPGAYLGIKGIQKPSH